MVLESYDKYEFQIIECNGYTPTQLVRKLNEMGNEGWRVVQSYGSLFRALSEASILMERKITCTKV